MKLKDGLLGAAIVLLGAGAFLYNRRMTAMEGEIALWKRRSAANASEALRLRDERDKARGGEVVRPEPNGIPAPPQRMPPTVLEGPHGKKILQLLDYLDAHPARSIPEMRLLRDLDWERIAADHALDSEDDYRMALSALRLSAKMRLAPDFSRALQAYAEANNQQLPQAVQELAPYFQGGVDPDILARYEMLVKGDIGNRIDSGRIKPVVGERSRVDDEYETMLEVGPDGQFGSRSVHGADTFRGKIDAGVAKWQKANPGKTPLHRRDIAPYMDSSIDPTRLKAWIDAAPPQKK